MVIVSYNSVSLFCDSNFSSFGQWELCFCVLLKYSHLVWFLLLEHFVTLFCFVFWALADTKRCSRLILHLPLAPVLDPDISPPLEHGVGNQDLLSDKWAFSCAEVEAEVRDFMSQLSQLLSSVFFAFYFSENPGRIDQLSPQVGFIFWMCVCVTGHIYS